MANGITLCTVNSSGKVIVASGKMVKNRAPMARLASFAQFE